MNSDWKNYNLIEHINVKHGFAFKGKHITTEETDNILLTPGNINIGGGFKSDKFKYYDTDQFPSEYILKKDDLIVTMTDLSKTGDTLGYVAKVPKTSRKKYLHNQRLGLINFITKDLDKDFLYWRLRTKKYQQFIVNSATGSTVRHTSPKRILEYSFNAPKDIQAQNKIAHILSTLDDKIELNRKMNLTLEEMAQALFNSWFVDFDPVHAKANASSDADFDKIAKELGISREVLDLFPNEFEESELGMIPRGWNIKRLNDISKVTMGQSPNGDSYNYDGNGLPLLNGAADFKDGILIPKKFTTDSKRKASKGELVFCIRATIGLLTYTDIEYSLGRGVASIIAYDLYKELIYLGLNRKIESLKSTATGSVIIGLKKDDIESTKFVVGNIDVMEFFDLTLSSAFDRIKINTNQTQTLQKTRNTLLPKLLSGELDVSELELDHVTH